MQQGNRHGARQQAGARVTERHDTGNSQAKVLHSIEPRVETPLHPTHFQCTTRRQAVVNVQGKRLEPADASDQRQEAHPYAITHHTQQVPTQQAETGQKPADAAERGQEPRALLALQRLTTNTSRPTAQVTDVWSSDLTPGGELET